MAVELDVAQPVLLPPRAGEVIGDATDRRVEILSEHDSLHATWSRFGPGRDGADLHVHRTHVDCFYVLEGEFTLRLGLEDRQVAAPAGTLVAIPPLVVHGFRNASGAELRYLNLHAPGRGFADYLRGMRDRRPVEFDQHDPPADGVRSPELAVIGAGRRIDLDEIAFEETEVSTTPRQVHHRHLRSLYVLEGSLAVDGREAKPGTWVQVPPATPYTLSGGARVLDVHTPGFGLGTLDREPA